MHELLYVWGDTFPLKTGSKLNVSQVVSGNASQVKGKIANAFLRKYSSTSMYSEAEVRSRIMAAKISSFPLYLKRGKVVLPLGEYAYGRSYAKGFASIALQGNYE